MARNALADYRTALDKAVENLFMAADLAQASGLADNTADDLLGMARHAVMLNEEASGGRWVDWTKRRGTSVVSPQACSGRSRPYFDG